jgi:hypothetical protein
MYVLADGYVRHSNIMSGHWARCNDLCMGHCKGLPGSILGTAIASEFGRFLVVVLGDIGLAAMLISGGPYFSQNSRPLGLWVRLC